MSGTVFLFIGVVACAFAAIRRSGNVRLFVWLGIWSGLFGLRLLLTSGNVRASLPDGIQSQAPLISTAITYLMLPAATLAWLELVAGGMRTFLRVVTVTGAAIAVAGTAVFAVNGSTWLLPWNNLVAAVSLAVLVVTVMVPRLARKYLVLPNRLVLIVGTLLFGIEALYFNVSLLLHYQTYRVTGALGFGALLFSFGYVAVQRALAGERKLMTIQRELAIAQEIQASILPGKSPELQGLRVAAVYHPMTEVAGDFYEFVRVDEKRIGILVADVTGHGVPAALIASMIKVAMQSVAAFADEPREVLRGLNRILSGQMREQLVSAAYLWLDTEKGLAKYSGAGHPPLLRLRRGQVECVESNGVLLGVLPEPEYPVREMEIQAGDRLVLYTDGVVEPHNANGEMFGEERLEQVIRQQGARPVSELLNRVLAEVRQWRPQDVEQQDDITMIAVDVV